MLSHYDEQLHLKNTHVNWNPFDYPTTWSFQKENWWEKVKIMIFSCTKSLSYQNCPVPEDRFENILIFKRPLELLSKRIDKKLSTLNSLVMARKFKWIDTQPWNHVTEHSRMMNISELLSLKNTSYSENIDFFCLFEIRLDANFRHNNFPSNDFNIISRKYTSNNFQDGTISNDLKNTKFCVIATKLVFYSAMIFYLGFLVLLICLYNPPRNSIFRNDLVILKKGWGNFTTKYCGMKTSIVGIFDEHETYWNPCFSTDHSLKVLIVFFETMFSTSLRKSLLKGSHTYRISPGAVWDLHEKITLHFCSFSDLFGNLWGIIVEIPLRVDQLNPRYCQNLVL